MSILDRIENLMETVIEGLFRKSNKGRLQPVEIGKRLIKTMESQKRVSVARTYVPNKYIVYFHPNQLVEFRALQSTFVKELKGVLHEKAEKEQLSFIGDLVIEFSEDPLISSGIVRIEAEFLALNDVLTSESTDTSVDENSFNNGSSMTQKYLYCSKNSGEESILIYQGSDGEQIFRLTNKRYSIGRSFKCDIVIEDSKVSRIHAWLYKENHIWRLKDNDSTNGTFVNDEIVSDRALNIDDIIRLGTAILIYRENVP